MIDLLCNRPESARALLLLAHGAGAPMDSDFMNQAAEGLACRGISVARFEFPYMQDRRATGIKKPPNRQQALVDCWHKAIEQAAADCSLPLFIGGKSMGGRMAALCAADEAIARIVRGVVCFGFPFHPPKKPESSRLPALLECRAPVFIAQGSRDPLGNLEEVAAMAIPPHVCVHWLDDGDHDLKPRVRSGFTHAQHITAAVSAATDFIDRHL